LFKALSDAEDSWKHWLQVDQGSSTDTSFPSLRLGRSGRLSEGCLKDPSPIPHHQNRYPWTFCEGLRVVKVIFNKFSLRTIIQSGSSHTILLHNVYTLVFEKYPSFLHFSVTVIVFIGEGWVTDNFFPSLWLPASPWWTNKSLKN
jgi:hypothetical protein